ncbi:Inactive pancreatic lipase-related protein 1 [Araneus ventricosus]|uniref:Inactive pancreatic lipase-related protein 1 n=1 Tax=Araneus ventricosus TaxID=182803 RepID=A0A4Y2TMG7_ARAVE|nr:Inactive pancreatic lipase-related protein 1 [Araneus ventricosus]
MDSDFDAGSPTKILIHGYTVKLLPIDVRFTMKDELLKEGSYNVIIVNWTDSNQFPYYQAFANGRVVGAQTAKLINLLMENKGITPDSVHLIGHSLGGQVSGWAGERVPGLGRITGLDPAGPFFQNAPKEVRLDNTDAEFVDVIHSNGGDNYVEVSLVLILLLSYTKKNTVPCRSFIAQSQSQSPKHFQSARHRMKILNLRQDAKLSSEARQANQQPLVHAPKTFRQPIGKLGLYLDWRSMFLRKRAGNALAPKG